MKDKMRALTVKHEIMLADSYKRYIKDEPPFGVYYSQTAKGLVERGLMESRDYILKGQKCYGFYITDRGINYVRQLKDLQHSY